MTEEAGRPQDQGRKHRRRGKPAPASQQLIDRYLDVMRAELAATLDELQGKAPDGTLGLQARPGLGDRVKLVALARTIRDALGAEIEGERPPDPDVDVDDQANVPPATTRRRRVRFD